MSLYDTLQSDYPLPDPEFQHEHFQTKDLNCTLSRYRITAEGRLWRLRQADPFAEDTPAPDPADKVADRNYHGDFGFYVHTEKERIEYRVRFTHGTVEWIRRATDEEPVVADSLARLAQNAEALEQEREARLEAFFQRLENLDAEVARKAQETFGDRASAASWLGRALHQFGDRSPYQMLANGKQRKVLEALTRIDNGFFA